MMVGIVAAQSIHRFSSGNDSAIARFSIKPSPAAGGTNRRRREQFGRQLDQQRFDAIHGA
jgi:hypothetical protein